jgi:hypothetical protein
MVVVYRIKHGFQHLPERFQTVRRSADADDRKRLPVGSPQISWHACACFIPQ